MDLRMHACVCTHTYTHIDKTHACPCISYIYKKNVMKRKNYSRTYFCVLRRAIMCSTQRAASAMRSWITRPCWMICEFWCTWVPVYVSSGVRAYGPVCWYTTCLLCVRASPCPAHVPVWHAPNCASCMSQHKLIGVMCKHVRKCSTT